MITEEKVMERVVQLYEEESGVLEARVVLCNSKEEQDIFDKALAVAYTQGIMDCVKRRI